jgi:hypothetical protein
MRLLITPPPTLTRKENSVTPTHDPYDEHHHDMATNEGMPDPPECPPLPADPRES